MSEETENKTPEPDSGGDEHIDWRGVAVFGLLIVGLLGIVDCICSWCNSMTGGFGLMTSAVAFGIIVHVGFRR
ncbi:MAG: hypothetical protein ACI8UO_005320 [Verrucomicrobiales bacterium]|jgi:hypothetical protein